MARKPGPDGKQTKIRVGNVSDIKGTVNVAGGNITTHTTTGGPDLAEIERRFEELYSLIEARSQTSSVDREDIKAELKDIQETVTEAAQNDEPLDEGFLSRRFRNLARMAPDVLDVVVTTLANPLAGLGVAVRKIADKAKEETGS